jgi:SAM-dependent methyltransferase
MISRGAMGQVLAAYCRGELSAGLSLMRLAMIAPSSEEFARAVAADDGLLDADPGAGERMAELRRLAASRPDAWHLVRTMLAETAPGRPAGADPIARCAAAFDRAVSRSAEASVALYTLGSSELIEAATVEVADFMRALDLLGRDRLLVDLGCGIGRFERALAGEIGHIIGLDVSPAMVAEARRRCLGLANVEIRLSSGRDLAGVRDASADCIFAVDSFPYIVETGATLVAAYFSEAARVLKPGGVLLILNYSYRGSASADRDDAARLGAAHRLALTRFAEHPLTLWDADAFHLVRQP